VASGSVLTSTAGRYSQTKYSCLVTALTSFAYTLKKRRDQTRCLISGVDRLNCRLIGFREHKCKNSPIHITACKSLRLTSARPLARLIVRRMQEIDHGLSLWAKEAARWAPIIPVNGFVRSSQGSSGNKNSAGCSWRKLCRIDHGVGLRT
jgi:hypothetical protein